MIVSQFHHVEASLDSQFFLNLSCIPGPFLTSFSSFVSLSCASSIHTFVSFTEKLLDLSQVPYLKLIRTWGSWVECDMHQLSGKLHWSLRKPMKATNSKGASDDNWPKQLTNHYMHSSKVKRHIDACPEKWTKNIKPTETFKRWRTYINNKIGYIFIQILSQLWWSKKYYNNLPQ